MLVSSANLPLKVHRGWWRTALTDNLLKIVTNIHENLCFKWAVLQHYPKLTGWFSEVPMRVSEFPTQKNLRMWTWTQILVQIHHLLYNSWHLTLSPTLDERVILRIHKDFVEERRGISGCFCTQLQTAWLQASFQWFFLPFLTLQRVTDAGRWNMVRTKEHTDGAYRKPSPSASLC